jgi:MFS family permease
MGLYRTYADMGFVVGPLLLGWIADATGSFGWSLGFNAVLLAACALLFGLFARETVGRRAEPPPAATVQATDPGP